MTYKVVTAVATEPVTLAEARLHIKSDSDTTEDSLIAIWISTARELAEHYTGRALAVQTLEMALDKFPCNKRDEFQVIKLDRPPVATITSVKYTDMDGAEQTVSSGDYALSLYGDARELAPAYGDYWPTPQCIPNAVRIRYVTGYATAPAAVKQALLLMVGWFDQNRGDTMQPDDIQPPAAKALLGTVKIWSK